MGKKEKKLKKQERLVKKSIKLFKGAFKALSKDDELKGAIFGRYADGTARSIFDAAHGEFLSPEQKEKIFNKNAKKGKKK